MSEWLKRRVGGLYKRRMPDFPKALCEVEGLPQEAPHERERANRDCYCYARSSVTYEASAHIERCLSTCPLQRTCEIGNTDSGCGSNGSQYIDHPVSTCIQSASEYCVGKNPTRKQISLVIQGNDKFK